MSQSNVYFINFRTTPQENPLQKLERLVKKVGMLEGIDLNDKYTTIKIHFGEPENLFYLRPNYPKVIVDLIKSQGGKVFLTDCNTLYVGGWESTPDHLNAAYENGYNPFVIGCHVLTVDGLKGADEILVPIGEEYIKEARIGRVIMDADIFISLTYFKGHESIGFSGTMKNIGMDCGSQADKMGMHNAGKLHAVTSKCVGCGACRKNCVRSIITITERKASIGYDKCVGYGRCIGVCPMDAMDSVCDEFNDILNYEIVEYTYTALKDRPHLHISFMVDVSPYRDCHVENDVPIVPDVGMFASSDPVALDMACTDAVNRQPVTLGSTLSEKLHAHRDYFTDTHPDTNWESAIDYAVKMGLGNKEYNLIAI